MTLLTFEVIWWRVSVAGMKADAGGWLPGAGERRARLGRAPAGRRCHSTQLPLPLGQRRIVQTRGGHTPHSSHIGGR